MKKIILVLVVLLSITACDIQPRIDASSEEGMQKSIAKVMKELDLDEQEKFQEALKIIMFSGVSNLMDLAAMGQNMEVTKGAFQAKVDGKSVTEIIQIAEEIRKKKESGNYRGTENNFTNNENLVDKLAEEGKSQTHQKLLNEAVKVSLKSIKAVQGDYSQKYVQVSIAFDNVSDKDIRGVKGIAVFDDIFGDTIKTVRLSSDEPILKGNTYLYEGSIDINQFSDEDLKLARTPKEKIQFSFQVETILYADNKKNFSKDVSGVPVSAEDFIGDKDSQTKNNTKDAGVPLSADDFLKSR